MSTTVEERAQFRRDRQTWQARLDALQVERDRELAAIDARYASRAHHVFPVALVIIVPRQEVTR